MTYFFLIFASNNKKILIFIHKKIFIFISNIRSRLKREFNPTPRLFHSIGLLLNKSFRYNKYSQYSKHSFSFSLLQKYGTDSYIHQKLWAVTHISPDSHDALPSCSSIMSHTADRLPFFLYPPSATKAITTKLALAWFTVNFHSIRSLSAAGGRSSVINDPINVCHQWMPINVCNVAIESGTNYCLHWLVTGSVPPYR